MEFGYVVTDWEPLKDFSTQLASTLEKLSQAAKAQTVGARGEAVDTARENL